MANKDHGNRGHWYWWGRYGLFGQQVGGSNVARKEIGSNSGLFHFKKQDYEGKDRWQYEEDPKGTNLGLFEADWTTKEPVIPPNVEETNKFSWKSWH